MRHRKDLRRYQVIFLNKIKKIPHIILALPMGSGKTTTTLTAIDDLICDREVKKVLVVAPLLVASATWPDEVEEWSHLSKISWTLIRAEDNDDKLLEFRDQEYRFYRDVVGLDVKEATSLAQRMKTKFKGWTLADLANSDTEVHFINREALPWLWDHFEQGKRWPYDMLVVDEASMFKNGKMRTPKKALTRFGVAAKARKLVKRTVLLTGTPSPKGVINLWGLSLIADLGERLGNSRHQFEKRYYDAGYMKWQKTLKPHAQDQIMDKLSDIMFSMREEDCVDLPPSYDIPIKVKLPKKILAEYKEFERELFSQEYDVKAVNNGVLHGKLMQFANGSMYNSDRKAVWIHDEKLFALEELVEEADGSPVLILYSFKFDLERICKRFPNAKVFGEGDVRKMKADWNAGKIEIMVAHAASIGHGQNIQFGGNICIWYGLTSDLELYLQAKKRLHRSGQKFPVMNYHIIAEGTKDEQIMPILVERNATQDDILDVVRVHLN